MGEEDRRRLFLTLLLPRERQRCVPRRMNGRVVRRSLSPRAQIAPLAEVPGIARIVVAGGRCNGRYQVEPSDNRNGVDEELSSAVQHLCW